MIRLFLIAGVFVFAAGIVQAASFDCSKAKTKIEKTVCADPQLSALDEKLASTYRTMLEKLSPEGQRQLREGQRQWLKALPDDCPLESVLRPCIQAAYNDRLRELASAMVQVGEYLFARVALFKTQVWTSAGGEQRTHEQRVSYPRIEAPRNSETAKWNEEKKRVLEEKFYGSDCGGSYEVGYDIAAVNGPIISLTFYESEYCDGMAHPMSQSYNESFDTSRGLYPLTSADFFVADTGWLEFLVQRSVRELPDEADEKMLESVVKDPSNWIIGKDGLTINFPHYTVAGYPAYSVTASWKILRPYLRPDAPIPR